MGMDIDGLGQNASSFSLCTEPCRAQHCAGVTAILLYKQVGLFLLCLQSKNNVGRGNPRQETRKTDENRTLSAQIENIVIAGAGQAGGRAAEALRAHGFQGAITILGEEPHPPYERPQLSKEMLHAPDTPVAYIKPAGTGTTDLKFGSKPARP